jgi:hypothetical protein
VTGVGPAPSDPLWVVASYYNPAGYRRRLHNFRAFRRHLAAPLLVVELSRDGRGELDDGDADILVRLHGDDRIWQKERLINLGTALLPPHVGYVAWVDADILFSDPDWPRRARAALDARDGMVQLFDRAVHLPETFDPAGAGLPTGPVESPFLPGLSLARTLREDRFETLAWDWAKRQAGVPVTSDSYSAQGFGWAARRETLMACGLYDGNVIGGGDSIPVFAYPGQIDAFLTARPFTDAHGAHVRQWVARAGATGLLAHVDDIAQTAWHLWHGTIANRNYIGRYHVLVDHGFDPARDVVRDAGVPLRWTDPAGPMAQAVARYFFTRREDGEAMAEQAVVGD